MVMSERRRLDALRNFLTGKGNENSREPLKWKNVVEEKIAQADMLPVRLLSTVGNTEEGFYISIVKPSETCSVVFFEGKLDSSRVTSAVVLREGDEPRLVFDFGNDIWGVLPRGVDTEGHIFWELERLNEAKKFDPTKREWHGRFPSVDAVLEAFKYE